MRAHYTRFLCLKFQQNIVSSFCFVLRKICKEIVDNKRSSHGFTAPPIQPFDHRSLLSNKKSTVSKLICPFNDIPESNSLKLCSVCDNVANTTTVWRVHVVRDCDDFTVSVYPMLNWTGWTGKGNSTPLVFSRQLTPNLSQLDWQLGLSRDKGTNYNAGEW